MAQSAVRFLFRFVLIYILDWVVIVGTIAFAGSLSFWATPNARPFSLTDPSISFPYQKDSKIPTWLLVLLAAIIPALIILVLTLALPSYSWRRKLYSLNTGLLGLGLAIATGMIITDGLKNLAGRPRPDFISRCDPHTDEAWIRNSTIGPGSLVDWQICRRKYIVDGNNLDEYDLRDGLRSFPSGHASMSFAGLTYLSMFFAEFVFLLPFPILTAPPVSAPIADSDGEVVRRRRSRRHRRPRTKMEALEPLLPRFPIMLALLICAVPILLALYISSTRFSDFRHHTFDIIAGALVGLFAGFTGWRWYGAWSCCGEGGRKGVQIREKRGREEEDSEERGEDLPKVGERRREVVPEQDLESGGWRNRDRAV